MPNDSDPLGLFEEENLTEIYFSSRVIADSPTTLILTLLSILVIAPLVVVSDIENRKILEITVNLIDLAITIISAILAFLVAGFTIFATLTDRNLLIEMALKIRKDTNISYLKDIFFAFYQVFIVYFCFLVFSIILKAAFPFIINYLSHDFNYEAQSAINTDSYKNFLYKFSFISYTVIFSYAIIIIHSFLYNIYTTLMLLITWQYKKSTQDHETS